MIGSFVAAAIASTTTATYQQAGYANRRGDRDHDRA